MSMLDLYHCPLCGSNDLLRTAWVYANGGKLDEVIRDGAFAEAWCNGCESAPEYPCDGGPAPEGAEPCTQKHP